MRRAKFRVRLLRPGPLTVAPIPEAVSTRHGFRGRQRVRGRIDDVSISSSLMSAGSAAPSIGGSRFALCVNKELLKKLGKKEGEYVTVEVAADLRPAIVRLPTELAAALAGQPGAQDRFDRLAPTHRKAFAQWVATAKRAVTRDERTRRVLELVKKGRTLR